MKQLLELYGDLETFLRQHDNLAPATHNKLLQHLDDPTKKAYLQLELAVTVDAGLSFVQATYKLEGDGPLALECYEVISSLTTAVTRCLTIPTYRQWQDVCLEETSKFNSSWCSMLLPVYSLACSTSMNGSTIVCKFLLLHFGLKVQEMQPDCAAVDSLSAFPFLDCNTMGNLKSELPQYLAAVEDISPTYSPLEFRKTHELSLSAWATVARKILLVQPSSASSERSLMLQYNKH